MVTVYISGKRVRELRRELNQIAQELDNTTHDVQSWEECLLYLLEDLEMFAMANDPRHPEQYEQMLKQLCDAIGNRLRVGEW
jgi:hypothetical protein